MTRPLHSDAVPDRVGGAAVGLEDEDALRRRRVVVSVGILLLDVEPLEPGRAGKRPDTTPWISTTWLVIGEVRPSPWTSWMKVAGAPHATSEATVKVTT